MREESTNSVYILLIHVAEGQSLSEMAYHSTRILCGASNYGFRPPSPLLFGRAVDERVAAEECGMAERPG
jgi:hypothetical protein